jgi:stage III sporulation protein AC
MDITILFKMAAIGIIVTVICQILKKSDRDDIATLVSIVGLVIVLATVVGMIGDLFTEIKGLFELKVGVENIWKSLKSLA